MLRRVPDHDWQLLGVIPGADAVWTCRRCSALRTGLGFALAALAAHLGRPNTCAGRLT